MRHTVLTLAVTGALVGASTATAVAMPTFAQATGFDCKVCHIQVPALNAYGRYVQRTAYTAMDPELFKKILLPVWVGESLNYDSATGPPNQNQFGNLAIHANGYADPDFTYHVQQWLVKGNEPGPLDTAWMSYNVFFNRNGHAVAGLQAAPSPSFFPFWMDLQTFKAPEMTVGEHTYILDGNRWGGKLDYVHDSLVMEAGYFGTQTPWDGPAETQPAAGTAMQWRVAYARPKSPIEVGAYGAVGQVPVSNGTDYYDSESLYAEID
ncbi:MAG TPA: hypothetical protein VKG44_05480, partial [Candidatus Baltobacteraceae bacterium]|nr:hypothetical protein [Candidatus Baltobacteraceae bacterium]